MMESLSISSASNDSSSSSQIISKLLGSLLLAAFTATALTMVSNVRQNNKARSLRDSSDQQDAALPQSADATAAMEDSIRVGFLGNSILYFNDCPRLVESMLQTRYTNVHQDSCLRGGATLPSLLRDGNGMHRKFATPGASRPDGSFDIGAPTVAALLQEQSSLPWDYIVMNDHTQAPTRPKSREATKLALKDVYAPLIRQSCPHATVVLIQTAAYRYPNVNGSDDLGQFKSFTNKIVEGYRDYADCLQSAGIACRIAPVGRAFAALYHDNPSLWSKLYSHDDFHFSPHGTWLEACVIYGTLTGTAPPVYRDEWWSACRRMQPDDEPPLLLPTKEEAEELRHVAVRVCAIVDD